MDYDYQQTMANMPMEHKPMAMEKEENMMYPEVYKKMHHNAVRIIQEMESKRSSVYLSEELLNQMCEELIKRSGFKETKESVQTMAPYYPYDGRGYYWRHYHYDGLRDIGRILFLNEIFGRGRRYGWGWRY